MATPLHPNHRAHLRASAISDEIIDERKYQTIGRTPNDTRGHDLLKRCGIPGWARRDEARYPGILVPLYRATGERISWQYRPDSPPKDPDTGKLRKYAAQAGRASVIDVHPRNKDRVVDPTVPIFITEGVKKGDALTTAGACAVTLSGVFNWRSKLGTLGDWEDIPLKGRDIYVCFDADAATNHNVANAMARLGRWLRSKGAGRVRYIVVPEQVNGTGVKGADDYLAAGGTLGELVASANPEPPNPIRVGDTFTDARLAETIGHDVLIDRFRWARGLGWLQWDGHRWREVDDKMPVEAIRVYVLDRFAQAVQAQNKVAAEGWYSLTTAGRMRSVLGLAAGVDGIHTDAADLDQRPDLINCPNGTVDLSTGELLPPDPDFLLTKTTGVAYHPEAWPGTEGGDFEAARGDWRAALQAIPDDTQEWFQLRYGQAISGYMTPDDTLIVQQGAGENGKSTVTAGVAGALGAYYLLVSERVILANPDAHPTELMDLRGARFAMIEETPEARRLTVARLKKTVGTPQITARRIAKDPVTFDATHSLFLSTNYTPIVEETDHGTWRRLALVRFPYTFRKRSEDLVGDDDRLGDPGLRQRLQQSPYGQHEVVLAWLVQGAVKWYANDQVMPEPPARVVCDTRQWRHDSDVILAFLDEHLVFDSDFHVIGEELMAQFNAFLKGHGHQEWSDKLFASRFGDHNDVKNQRIEKRRVRHGQEGLNKVSRPPWSDPWKRQPEPPPRYRAWLGLRFRTAADDAGSAESDMSVEPDATSNDASPGRVGPAGPVDSTSLREQKTSGPPGPSGASDLGGDHLCHRCDNPNPDHPRLCNSCIADLRRKAEQ